MVKYDPILITPLPVIDRYAVAIINISIKGGNPYYQYRQ